MKVALTLGEPPLSRNHYAVFLVVKLSLSYNAILKRLMLYDFEAMTSIQYLTIKFPTKAGVRVVRARQEEARVVYLATVEEQYAQPKEVNPEVMEVRDEKKEVRAEPVDKLETFQLSKEEGYKVLSINSSLEESQREAAMALI